MTLGFFICTRTLIEIAARSDPGAGDDAVGQDVRNRPASARRYLSGANVTPKSLEHREARVQGYSVHRSANHQMHKIAA